MPLKLKKRLQPGAAKTRSTAPVEDDVDIEVDEEASEEDIVSVLSKSVAGAVAKAVKPIAEELKGLRQELSEAEADEDDEEDEPEVRVAATRHTRGLRDQHQRSEEEEPLPSLQPREVEPPQGVRAIRCIKAAMVAKMRAGSATVESVLKEHGYKQEVRAMARTADELAKVRALGTITFADGGVLIPSDYSTELIALLRNVTLIRRAMTRPPITINAKLDIPKQTGASTAYWIGEGQAITPSQPSFGGLSLTPKKLASLVPIANDLIRNASIGAEMLVRDDMVSSMAIKEDLTYLFGTGGDYSPRGIQSIIDTNNHYTATAVSAGAPTLAEVKKEIGKAKKWLKKNNIPMTSLAWFASPTIEEYLWSITDGNGNATYQAGLDANPQRLAGFPFYVSNQIPETLGSGGNESRLFLVDMAQVIIADSSTLPLTVEVFPNATYDNSGTIVSGISNDQSVIRGLMGVDFGMRYNTAAVEVDLQWGLV